MIFEAANRRRTRKGINGAGNAEEGPSWRFHQQFVFQTCASELKGFPDISSRDYPIAPGLGLGLESTSFKSLEGVFWTSAKAFLELRTAQTLEGRMRNSKNKDLTRRTQNDMRLRNITRGLAAILSRLC